MDIKDDIKILILEDNQFDFVLLNDAIKAFEKIQVDIIHAKRLQEAIELIKGDAIDAAILDLKVPDSMGLETYTTFQKEFPDIPVIIMSGTKTHELSIEAIQKGAQDYLYKGEQSSSVIVRTILYAIERHHLKTEQQKSLKNLKILGGIIPICSVCKKIRDSKNCWNQLESYITKHSEAKFSHGICRDCFEEMYSDYIT